LAVVEHIVRLANHLLKVLVKVARLVLTQVKETLTKPNVKSNYAVLKIINLTPVLIVLSWSLAILLEVGTPKMDTSTRSTNKLLNS
jgi:hypothetical protein